MQMHDNDYLYLSQADQFYYLAAARTTGWDGNTAFSSITMAYLYGGVLCGILQEWQCIRMVVNIDTERGLIPTSSSSQLESLSFMAIGYGTELHTLTPQCFSLNIDGARAVQST